MEKKNLLFTDNRFNRQIRSYVRWAYVEKWHPRRPKASCATSVKFVWLGVSSFQLLSTVPYSSACLVPSYSPRYVRTCAHAFPGLALRVWWPPVRRGRSPVGSVHRPCYFYEWLAGNVISRACNYDGMQPHRRRIRVARRSIESWMNRAASTAFSGFRSRLLLERERSSENNALENIDLQQRSPDLPASLLF